MPTTFLFQGQVTANVPTVRATGVPIAQQLQLGELAGSYVQAKYGALTWSGQCFSASLSTAANNTAFTGGAGGTPFIAVWNPPGTGKNLWPITVNWADVAAATTTTGSNNWALWWGPTAAISATPSTSFPINQLTLQATGSATKVFINAATTGSSALTNMQPIGTYYWTTPAAQAAQVSNSIITDVPGHVVVPPGSMMALGGSAALTATTYIANLVWVELPV